MPYRIAKIGHKSIDLSLADGYVETRKFRILAYHVKNLYTLYIGRSIVRLYRCFSKMSKMGCRLDCPA